MASLALESTGTRQIDTYTAQRLGADIVLIFEQIDAMPDKLQWVYREIAKRLGTDVDPSLDRACATMAAFIDADPSEFDRHPYHNRQHYCEVTLTAYYLCMLDHANPRETQWVLLAALIHDFVHAGTSRAPFELERESVDRARPLLEAAGVRAGVVARIAALVLATDPSEGTRFMSAVWRAHGEGGAMPPVPRGAPELRALAKDDGLAHLARLLCEADILPSIGLTLAHSMRLQERLSREWQRPLSERDKLDFIDRVIACGFLGDFFLPNVEAIRRALAKQLHESVTG